VLEPDLVKTILDLGLSGALLFSVWALGTRRVIPKGALDDYRHDAEADRAELRKDRDEWKALANAAVARLDRVGDLLEDVLRNGK
jgi:hypothetical protein